MKTRKPWLIAIGACAGAVGLAGVVLVGQTHRGDPARPAPQVEGEPPVELGDPGALLAQVEPSPDGRWVALGVDVERVAGSQTLYALPVDGGAAVRLGDGVLAARAWDGDGRIVYVDRSGTSPRAVWFDVESGEVARTTSARELPGVLDRALTVPQWAQRSQKRLSSGGYRERIAWRSRDEELVLEVHSLFDLEVSPTPGVVIELRRSSTGRSLFRHDMRSAGAPAVLAQSKDLALFRLSPDGAKVLVSERNEGEVRFEARSAVDGRVLAGPWSGEAFHATWLARPDSRYVLATRGLEAELIDVDTGEVTALGAHEAAELDVRVLNDGRILVRGEKTVDVLDASGARQRRLFPPPAAH